MSALAKLLCSDQTAANPANSANPDPEISKISNFSRGSSSKSALEPIDLDAEREARRLRREAVLEILKSNPGTRQAWRSDDNADPDHVIVTVAIRGLGSCELSVPRDRFDAFEWIKAMEPNNVP